MTDTTTFTSPRIANKMEKLFGNDAKKVTVEIKNRGEIGNFIRKIDRAHNQAKKSKQTFK